MGRSQTLQQRKRVRRAKKSVARRMQLKQRVKTNGHQYSMQPIKAQQKKKKVDLATRLIVAIMILIKYIFKYTNKSKQ